jgi:hypothetical protein
MHALRLSALLRLETAARASALRQRSAPVPSAVPHPLCRDRCRPFLLSTCRRLALHPLVVSYLSRMSHPSLLAPPLYPPPACTSQSCVPLPGPLPGPILSYLHFQLAGSPTPTLPISLGSSPAPPLQSRCACVCPTPLRLGLAAHNITSPLR